MKIDDNKPGAIEVRRPVGREGVPRTAETSGAVATANAGPAASVSLGAGANVAAAGVVAAVPSDELSDVELLDRLREQLEKGEFEVDYSKLARSVLEDAIAIAKGMNESN